MPLIHFLLVFDLGRQELLEEPREFTDAKSASDAYAAAEKTYATNRSVEVVLVGADSIETIRKTHGNYFEGSSVDASPYLAAVS